MFQKGFFPCSVQALAVMRRKIRIANHRMNSFFPSVNETHDINRHTESSLRGCSNTFRKSIKYRLCCVFQSTKFDNMFKKILLIHLRI